MAAPGPLALGRGVVVLPGTDPPSHWAECPRVVIDQQVLDEPSAALATLQQAWSARQPVTVELAVDSKVLQERETCPLPVHELSPHFEFARERLHFLVWANNYDARNGEPIWWHGRKALRSFATQGVQESDRADIELADGTALWVDGGPFAPTADADGIRDRAPLEHRGGITLAGRPPPARGRPGRRPARRASATPPAGPGSSPRPARARRGCSPSASVTCSKNAARPPPP